MRYCVSGTAEAGPPIWPAAACPLGSLGDVACGAGGKVDGLEENPAAIGIQSYPQSDLSVIIRDAGREQVRFLQVNGRAGTITSRQSRGTCLFAAPHR